MEKIHNIRVEIGFFLHLLNRMARRKKYPIFIKEPVSFTYFEPIFKFVKITKRPIMNILQKVVLLIFIAVKSIKKSVDKREGRMYAGSLV